MKLRLQKSHTRRAVGLAVLALSVFTATWPRAVAESNSSETVELTRTDLFSLPDWQNKNVSVGGFIPGMTRSQALQLAQTRGWVLHPDMPTKTAGELTGPCTEPSCGIYVAHGDWIGLDLYFDGTDRVSSIKVFFPPDDADPQVKGVNIVRQFKGRTREFFSHYSDELQNRVLGHVEAKRRKSATDAYLEYDYPALGVIVHFTIDTRDNPVKPFDLEVDFMAHQ